MTICLGQRFLQVLGRADRTDLQDQLLSLLEGLNGPGGDDAQSDGLEEGTRPHGPSTVTVTPLMAGSGRWPWQARATRRS
jgi:hypothetical protein